MPKQQQQKNPRLTKNQLVLILGYTFLVVCAKLMTMTHNQQNSILNDLPVLILGYASFFTDYKGVSVILTSGADGRICHLKI